MNRCLRRQVEGECRHRRQSELFQKSPHKPIFQKAGDCIVCHNNHDIAHPTDAMLGNDCKAICTVCHTEGEDAFYAAGRMRLAIGTVAARIGTAEAILDRSTRLGMEVSKVKFELNGARDRLVDARVVVHAFSPEQLGDVVKPGIDIALTANQEGRRALDEANVRRRGLILSLVIIALAILAIYLKVRQIERRTRE
jgi:predicted CXXCH cytochrome family protein